MEENRIRDPGWKKVGFGILDNHPGFATLVSIPPFKFLFLSKFFIHMGLVNYWRNSKISAKIKLYRVQSFLRL